MDLINSPAFAVHVNDLLQQYHVPGISISIIQNETVASNSFGFATLDPSSYMTTDTLFDIASSSKSLTAASVGLFVEDVNFPQLHWDTPMSHLLPEDFVMTGDGYTEQVTVEDILSHRSGFPRHDYSYLGIRAKHPDTPQSVTQNLRHLPNAAPLRTKFLYSNIMFIVASWLVEKMSGIAFADFLHQNFFEPLGMNSTYLQPDAAIDAGLRDRMAIPYTWRDETKSFLGMDWQQVPESQGCGSIFTSVNDYIFWVRALMNKEPPISDYLYEGLTKPRIQDQDDLSWYAAGLAIYSPGGYKLIGHNGGVNGFQSIYFFMPDLKFGAVLLANGDNYNEELDGSLTNTIAVELIEDVLGLKQSDNIAQNKRKRHLGEMTERTNGKSKPILPSGGKGDKLNDITLQAYAGRYCNAGYRCLTVETQTDTLFIDASDHSESFTVRLEHVYNNTIFIAHVMDYWDHTEHSVPAEFKLMGRKVSSMGLLLEAEIEEYIWFDKVNSKERQGQAVLGVD